MVTKKVTHGGAGVVEISDSSRFCCIRGRPAFIRLDLPQILALP